MFGSSHLMQYDKLRTTLEEVISKSNLTRQLLSMFHIVHEKNRNNGIHVPWTKYLIENCQFYCFKERSIVPNAGYGVFIRSNNVIKRGQIVSLYPGLIYFAHEPKFFQSIGNSFILQRKDFTYIDENDQKLKRIDVCDSSWLRFYEHRCENDINEKPVKNPFNIGHYINSPINNNMQEQANVMYYEYDFCVRKNAEDKEEQFVWSIDLQYLIPNTYYQPNADQYSVKSIVLIALRDIRDGEELFASYHNLVVT